MLYYWKFLKWPSTLPIKHNSLCIWSKMWLESKVWNWLKLDSMDICKQLHEFCKKHNLILQMETEILSNFWNTSRIIGQHGWGPCYCHPAKAKSGQACFCRSSRLVQQITKGISDKTTRGNYAGTLCSAWENCSKNSKYLVSIVLV